MEKSYKTTDTRQVCMLDFMIILTQVYHLTQVSSTFTTILSIINISLWLIILTINLFECINIWKKNKENNNVQNNRTI